jgi:hypothetical protein
MQCLFLQHLQLEKMRMLAFRQPVILVGAAQIDDMYRACHLLLQPIWTCTVPVLPPRPYLLDQLITGCIKPPTTATVAAAAAAENERRRRRQQSSTTQAKKKPRLGMPAGDDT